MGTDSGEGIQVRKGGAQMEGKEVQAFVSGRLRALQRFVCALRPRDASLISHSRPDGWTRKSTYSQISRRMKPLSQKLQMCGLRAQTTINLDSRSAGMREEAERPNVPLPRMDAQVTTQIVQAHERFRTVRTVVSSVHEALRSNRRSMVAECPIQGRGAIPGDRRAMLKPPLGRRRRWRFRR